MISQEALFLYKELAWSYEFSWLTDLYSWSRKDVCFRTTFARSLTAFV